MARVSAAMRRTQLIDAASRVISRKGVVGATTREIAKEANAALVSLHYVYGSKQDLLLDLIRNYATTMADVLAETKDVEQGGLRPAVRAILAAYFDFDRAVAFAGFEILLWSLRTDLAADEAPALYERITDQLETALRNSAKADEEHVDFRALAKLLITIADGILFTNLCTNSQFVSKDEIMRMADIAVTAALQS